MDDAIPVQLATVSGCANGGNGGEPEQHGKRTRSRCSSSEEQDETDSEASSVDSPEFSEEDDDSYSDNQSAPSTPATPVTPKSPRRESPSRVKTLRCPFPSCSRLFNRPVLLLEHFRTHTDERPFRCLVPGCGKAFRRNGNLRVHTENTHNLARDHVCPRSDCGKAFVTAYKLRRHTAMHEKQNKFRCTGYEGCTKAFRKRMTLQRHVEAVHLHCNSVHCEHIDANTDETCGEVFATKGMLLKHNRENHSSPRFWCNQCPSQDGPSSSTVSSITVTPSLGLGFYSYSGLKQHLRSVHPPTCASCGHVCTSLNDLQKHLQVKHDHPVPPVKAPQYICPEPGCERSFRKPSIVELHHRTVHLNQKRFICTTEYTGEHAACGNAYKTKATLLNHVKKAHVDPVRKSKTHRVDVMDCLTKARLPALDGSDQDRRASGDATMIAEHEEAFEDAFDALLASELTRDQQRDQQMMDGAQRKQDIAMQVAEGIDQVLDPALTLM